jgi:hypothetical protein
MANVLLLSSAPSNDPSRPYPYDELNRMKRSAAQDTYGVHHCTDDPEQADVILFVENCDTIRHFFEVRQHPYLCAYREKCFLFTKYDHPIPFLPGVYPSIEKQWYAEQRTRSGGYLQSFGNGFIDYDPEWSRRDYLYSFVGAANTHPVRSDVLGLEHEDQYLLDTSPFWPYDDLADEKREWLENQYVEVAHRSKFILCPRGRGPSSIRLFESMRMGRAPVIIADQWVPPKGPDWSGFSLRVAEDDVSEIPHMLAEHEERADEMGRRARQTWEDWFSTQATFHRVTEWCLDIKQTRERDEARLRYSVLPQLLHPLYFKTFVKSFLPKRLRKRLSQ